MLRSPRRYRFPEFELARSILAQWDNSNGISKSQLERQTWGDGSPHSPRFDRYIRGTLGVETSRRSLQTDRITDFEKQIEALMTAATQTFRGVFAPVNSIKVFPGL